MRATAVIAELLRIEPSISELQMCYYLPAPPRVHTEDERYNVFIAAQPWREFFDRVNDVGAHLEVPGHWSLAVTSCVRMRWQSGHIPLLDFRERASPDGLALVRRKLEEVIRPELPEAFPGYVLVSGQSYHYIGLGVLDQEQWLRFMGLALLCESHEKPMRHSPVDRLWLGHSLVRGFGALRILPSPEKPYEPKVVAHIE